jgi:16S rRNA (guanine966-N2)-methyltransferase
MLQIMGGEWSGRKLHVPSHAKLRPSAGRVKAAIFSILESIQMKRGNSADFSGLRCLDLFAGVGGLGFEALSRGAAHTVFVEKDRSNAGAIEKNAKTLECTDRVSVISHPVEKTQHWAKQGPFDLVFIDPPYEREDENELLALLMDCLNPDAIVIFEHDPRHKLAAVKPLSLHSERKLGPAGLSVFICSP